MVNTKIVWLSPEEAAQKLGVSIVTLYRYINQKYGKLPSYKISSSNVRISESELNDWVKDHHRGAVINSEKFGEHEWTESEKGEPGYE